MAQIGKLLARMFGLALLAARFKHHSAARHGEDQILAFGAILVVTQTHRAVTGSAMWHEPIVKQAGGVAVGHEYHGSAVATIAAVRPGQRLVLLATNTGRTVAAVAATDMDGYSIHKITHIDYLTKKPRPYGRGLKSLTLYRSGSDDVDDLAVTAHTELHRAISEGEQRVILAHADVLARVEVGATLADDDVAGHDASPPNFFTPRY